MGVLTAKSVRVEELWVIPPLHRMDRWMTSILAKATGTRYTLAQDVKAM